MADTDRAPRTREEIEAGYLASWKVKQRILADPELMAFLRQKLDELNEDTPR